MYQYLSSKKLSLPIALSVVLASVSLLGQFGPEWLSYDRVSILNGELWRLVTSHLTHTGFNHLALNILGLIIVFHLFGQLFSTRFWILSIAVCMLGISLGLLVNHPELGWYVGLSGVLHGLIVVGTIGAIKSKCHIGYFVLIAVFSKLIFEQVYGASQNTINFINSPVIVDAHFYGAITGLFLALLCTNNIVLSNQALNSDG